MADVSQIKLPNGSVYDLIDEKSGYITAEYIENKTDYEIPVSRVGEIVVGETAIGTDSTNFPTSKAVVDYVDERVVQEMAAIDVGVISVNGKTGSVTLSASDVGAITQSELDDELTGFDIYLQNHIPTSTSQLTNDSGFITSETDPTVPAWAKASTKPTYTASEVGALSSDTVIPEDKVFIATCYSTTYADTLVAYNAGKLIFGVYSNSDAGKIIIPLTRYSGTSFQFEGKYLSGRNERIILGLNSSGWTNTSTFGDIVNRSATISENDRLIIRDADDNFVMKYSSIAFGTSTSQYLANNGTWQSIPTVPTTISSFTNDSGYLTASDIASVMTYKGTKANYAALPSTGNTTGDVWHLTDTGAEWAWDGSAWQELGTAIDVSSFLTSETDPVFTASPAHGIAASDITNWNGKTAVSIVRW